MDPVFALLDNFADFDDGSSVGVREESILLVAMVGSADLEGPYDGDNEIEGETEACGSLVAALLLLEDVLPLLESSFALLESCSFTLLESVTLALLDDVVAVGM